MRDVLKYSGWRPGENPIFNQRLLEECQARSGLASNRSKNLVAGCLSPRRNEALYYVAQGLDNAQIADHMGTTRGTIRNNLYMTFPVLDAASRIEASLKGVGIGAISLRDLVEPDEQDLLSAQLVGRKKDVMNAIVEEYGAESSIDQIAHKLRLKAGTVRNYFYNIMQATGINGRTRLAIIRFSLDH